jgi:hypothetical protein
MQGEKDRNLFPLGVLSDLCARYSVLGKKVGEKGVRGKKGSDLFQAVWRGELQGGTSV